MNKISNEYADVLGRELYSAAPKTIIAAVVVSLFVRDAGCGFDGVQSEFLREWWTLYDNCIVPQKPPFPKPEEV